MTLSVKDVLFQPNGPLPFAYFPTESVVTLDYAVEDTGAMAKAWPVGREGVVGISLFLVTQKYANRAEVQFGSEAFCISSSVLLTEFQRGGALQRLLLRYGFALVTQASQLGVCSQYHSIDQRLCRFRSRAFDQIGGDEVFMTHERISKWLGVRRVSIIEIAFRRHTAGIIQNSRGCIRLKSRSQLEARACTCAGIIRRAFGTVTA